MCLFIGAAFAMLSHFGRLRWLASYSRHLVFECASSALRALVLSCSVGHPARTSSQISCSVNLWWFPEMLAARKSLMGLMSRCPRAWGIKQTAGISGLGEHQEWGSRHNNEQNFRFSRSQLQKEAEN
ncbi:predicted protein [Aspergillus nidulans FGSC A4]|uniref:Secreted protein n=1 Tax=Emericella nidulans (strain FGSC A4 / ATCC 38163 / CBS 112.46 / NRRL 194 / M139) TaxID=227321 RepID=Q5B5D8_EMENI|nr:hypothetical protein [Aspergillus nidulans FGSC A4]EAA59341.1 predicted protein [Aspergillus nidulans FGSC A4]CBF74408.1 TPA: conserved hypothetical protein [Aspergillus nidulans FGSC A4]|eukprot:XP_661846.1 predicted protein [Aspergillus nidulans FGSC A4]